MKFGDKVLNEVAKEDGETYYEEDDETGALIGHCPEHGEFIGDAIGCPKCFARQEEAEAFV